MSDELWEEHASWWQKGFTDGADPEYEEQILPLISEWMAGATKILDLGTGEGQAARMLAESGASVTGIDLTTNQIREAQHRGGGPVYAQASADALPFGGSAFDAVVACLVFEHIDEIEPAVTEVARVLEPGGRFMLLLNHPLIQTPNSGWIDDQILDPPEQYWRIGEYLVETETVEQVEKGVFIRFVHRPLSKYLNTLADEGLVLEQMLEPAPPQGFLDRAPGYYAASTIPRVMALITRRVDTPD